jgi:hypothetical protein
MRNQHNRSIANQANRLPSKFAVNDAVLLHDGMRIIECFDSIIEIDAMFRLLLSAFASSHSKKIMPVVIVTRICSYRNGIFLERNY